jgi:hypothetical protein
VRTLFFVMYCVMALWLVVAAVLRVLLSLSGGIPLDVLPAITGGLGLFALLAVVPRTVRRIRDRPRPPTGRMIPVPLDSTRASETTPLE